MSLHAFPRLGHMGHSVTSWSSHFTFTHQRPGRQGRRDTGATFDVFEVAKSENICGEREHCGSHSFNFIVLKY